MQKRNIAIRFTFAIALGVTALGCSSSDPKNGTLICGTGTHPCPEGYLCSQETNTCWKNGTLPSEDSGSTNADTHPAADAAIVPDVVPDVVGRDTMSANDLSTDNVVPGDAPHDGPLGDVTPDGPGTDVPLSDASTDVPLQDANTPDLPLSPGDVAPTCPSGKVICGAQCIDPPPAGCCAASDCTGTCMTCGADHTCVAAKNQDDPNKVCAGTCDATGVCKKQKGQSCPSAATDCVGGTTCSPDGICCDSACTGTCEACDLAANPGTCTTLSAGSAPHKGHTACTATDAACAGTCNGTSASCTYPATACGTATCTGLVYQPKGACSAGACAVQATQTCANLCSVTAGGCTGVCTPDKLQCSTSNVNVPQKCSADGAWQDQTACGSGFACSAGTCTCSTPKTACSNSCVDLQTDSNNCGRCGHTCGSGACLAGQCQPVAVTGTLSLTPTLFGSDSQYLYYTLPSSTATSAFDAYRVLKTSQLADGTIIYANYDPLNVPFAVISPTLFIYDAVGATYKVTIGNTTTKTPLGNPDPGIHFAQIGSMGARYYAQDNSDKSSTMSISWYDPSSNALVATYSESTTGIAPAGTNLQFSTYFLGGDSVYWIRGVYDSNSNAAQDNCGLFTASPTKSTPTQLAGSSAVGTMSIIDVNDKSVLLRDTNNYLYRVPLPAGLGMNLPDGTSADAYSAVEDASYLYWISSSGAISRCAGANCQATPVQLVSAANGGQSALYQDANAIYWIRSSPQQLMRLAK